MKKFLIIGLLSFLFLSCEKSNIDLNLEYIGVWVNVTGNLTRTFEVKPNGKCFYEKRTTTGSISKYISFNGRFILEGSTIKVGFKKLTVNEEPALQNGTWHLTLDDIKFYKE